MNPFNLKSREEAMVFSVVVSLIQSGIMTVQDAIDGCLHVGVYAKEGHLDGHLAGTIIYELIGVLENHHVLKPGTAHAACLSLGDGQALKAMAAMSMDISAQLPGAPGNDSEAG